MIGSALLFASGSTAETPRSVASYRAVVDDRQIDHWHAFGSPDGGGFDSGSGDPQVDRATSIQQMVLTLTLALEAERRGIHLRPEVAVELERARFRALKGPLQASLGKEIEMSDEQVEDRFQEIRDGFAKPRRVRLRNLYKRFPPDAGEADRAAVRQEMEALRERALAGESFAELAEQASDSQTRLQGGLLGNLRPGTLRADVDAVAMALEEGEISDILQGPDGLTLLYCERILDPIVRSEDEVRNIARDQLTRSIQKQRWQELQERLQARAESAEFQRFSSEPSGLEDILVSFPGGTLSRSEVAAIAGVQPHELKDPLSEPVRGSVLRFLAAKMLVREAYSRGTAEEIRFEDRWLWQRRRVLSSRVLAEMIQERLTPFTAEEKEKYFEENRSELKKPPQFQLRVVALETESHDLREVYDQAARIRYRIENGELSLEEAARRFSSHPTREQGGKTGWISRWAIPRRFGIDFLRELKRLRPQELSQWVLSEGFLWLLRIESFEPERPITYKEAEKTIETRLGNLKVSALEQEVIREWVDGLELEQIQVSE